MAVRIKMAKDGQQLNVSNGVRVFNDENKEITNIIAIDVRFRPNEIVTATIEVAVNVGESRLEDIMPLFDCNSLEELASSRGYKLVPNED
jgi:hypothetical protein